jgi:lantibiotic biosynthesis protein
MSKPAWEVIVPVDQADRMQCAVADVARELATIADTDSEDRPPSAALPEEQTVSLSQGAAGRHLFHWYWTVGRRDADLTDRRTRLLRWLSEVISSRPLSPGLYSGVTGLMWMYCHVLAADGADEQNNDDLFVEFDTVFADAVSAWHSDEFDLVMGLCGLGVYALERMPSDRASSCLESVVSRLASLAQWDRRGAWWLSSPDSLSGAHRLEYPEGWCDLGMAHGIGGIIGLLAQVLEYHPHDRESAKLLEAAVDFTMAVARGSGSGTDLPSALAIESGCLVGRRVMRTWPAWCYGSLGLACALTRAAAVAGSDRWRAVAIDMARANAARLSGSAPLQEDTGICHGIAGTAHMLNRLYQRSGDILLRDTAVACYDRLLRSRVAEDPSSSVAGFRALIQRDEIQPAEWQPSTSFLYGAAGIGLTLLAGSCSVTPSWDRVLLI